jgi:hypothetical protein
VVGFTIGSRGKVPGKTCEKRRNNNNNNLEYASVVWNSITSTDSSKLERIFDIPVWVKIGQQEQILCVKTYMRFCSPKLLGGGDVQATLLTPVTLVSMGTTTMVFLVKGQMLAKFPELLCCAYIS